MQPELEEVVNRCLVAIGNGGPNLDEQFAWLDSLQAFANNIDFTQSQLRHLRTILGTSLSSNARVVLTRILISGSESYEVSELFDSYLQALAQVTHKQRMNEGGVLGVFFRGNIDLLERWHLCLEVLGIDTTVSLLAQTTGIDFPPEAITLFTESNRVQRRASVIWDFVMVASPSAWRHAHSRRPDFRDAYWHSLLDWPFDGTQNSSELVAQNIVSAREALIFESFGAQLFEHTNQYRNAPSEAMLVDSPILCALGEKALRKFFGPDFQTALVSIYSGPSRSSPSVTGFPKV